MYLVTGSTGFIGSQLCRALVARGIPVRAFHRPNSPTLALQGLEVEHATGDVTQPETLVKALQGVEVVFHAAAQLGSPTDPQKMYAVTVQGTRNLLQAARQAGVRRVVHTSSVAALGVPTPANHATPRLIDESHIWNYRPEWWRYGHAKHLAEQEVQKAVSAGLDAVIVNPAVVLGAGDLNRVSGDVIIQVARGRLPVAVDGGLNAIHIADVVQGHLAALERGRTGERYILGGENLTLSKFLGLIAEVTGARPPFVTLPGGLVRAMTGPVIAAGKLISLPVSPDLLRKAGYYFYYDTLKAKMELRVSQYLPVRQAIVEAYKWYRENGMA
jgi:dihydroflavonol-4-reductase